MPVKAFLQSSLVFWKGMIRAGLFSLRIRLSRIVEAPQYMQKPVADTLVVMISPPHWGQV